MTNAEIQIGEYVRTKQGYIAKLERISEDKMYLFDDTIYCDYEEQPLLWESRLEEITKQSFNIIDLIEEGDYVNGMQVDEFDDEDGNLYLGFGIFTDCCMNCIEEVRPLSTVKIKSIVTKEQFKSMEYEVSGENE